jgi:thymidylate synthase (FAD)
MNVKLISLSNPLIAGINKPEELITYCARVSNPSNQLNTQTAPNLIKYLIEHKHWSPFEMVFMTVEIQTSRAIAAQILRHRSFSFQEFSQRYSQVTELEDLQWRKQGKTNRQVGNENIKLLQEYREMVESSQKTCLKTYELLLENGIAKECARMILPLNTKTTMYMSGTIRSWVHYIDLRSTEDTQKEHREIALKIKDIFINNFPDTSKALKWLN